MRHIKKFENLTPEEEEIVRLSRAEKFRKRYLDKKKYDFEIWRDLILNDKLMAICKEVQEKFNISEDDARIALANFFKIKNINNVR